ncbi:polysaccharide deacetylase family protein [Legionella impletisoli]|uniref:Polysaccharide deacetylase n=1 Tax=Legionella impletisoli TaxID=343510 RepID=A0A917JUX0_9GAMM|nr:polysaccharide deacetylase family protein [Legionella impletisoli]GGI87984.1 polysaccharide deacetylase [Legionella impletisoli]
MRDMVGYGNMVPEIKWPNKAHLALNFVVNYEEGAELTPLNGDRFSETYGVEFSLSKQPKGARHLSMESLFEYGSRSGIWRLLHLFDQELIPLTFFVTGFALTLNPAFSNYLRESEHEVAGHGWRWIDYSGVSKKEEKHHIHLCLSTLSQLTQKDILGWYTGRRSAHTLDLLKELGGLMYHSDSYADDLPYFDDHQLIIPYTLDCNDFRYCTSPGFSHADEFFLHLKNTFDYLYHEKKLALMTIGLHPRISGRPGRTIAIQKFINYVKAFQNVWIARRIDIARYWLNTRIP